MTVSLLLMLAASLLATVKSSSICDVDSPNEATMWHGGCDSDATALVGFDVNPNSSGWVIDAYLIGVQEYIFQSQNLIPGYNVLSLPKSFFTSRPNATGIVVQRKNYPGECQLNITLDPTISGLQSYNPVVMPSSTVSSLSAKVEDGRGLIFSFTISIVTKNTTQALQTVVVKPCNMSTLEAKVQFFPPTVGEYTVFVMVLMDEKVMVATSYVLSGDSIPDAYAVIQEKNHFHPGSSVNVGFNPSASAHTNKSAQSNCTINWGDGTVLNEGGIYIKKISDKFLLYARSHIYKELGKYTIFMKCFNPLNEVKGTLRVKVQSPAEFADVNFKNTLLPLSSVTNEAKGILMITHQYLTEDYPELNITVDFGLLNSKRYLYFTFPVQPMEQLYTQKGTYTVSVIFKAYGFIKEVKITIQIGVFDFYIKNKPSMVQAYTKLEFEIVRFSKNGIWDLELNFGPEIQTKTFLDGTDILYVPYTYNDTGAKSAVASVVVNSTKEVAIFEFTIFYGCMVNTDLFDALYRSEKTPLAVSLSELPTIAGWVERSSQCSKTENFLFNWQLFINIGIAPVYVWDPISLTQPGTVSITLKQFINKSGLYYLILTITETSNNQIVKDHMFLQVFQPPIVADIFGGTVTQHSIGKYLILDAETVSYDPVMDTPEDSNLSFSWSCFMLTSKFDIIEVTQPYSEYLNYTYNTSCPLQLPTTGKVNVSTVNFTNEDLVLFEVTASNNGLKDTAVKVVEMLQAQLPVVAIECKWNCGTKLVVEDRTVFTSRIECSECSSKDIYYAKHQWSLFKIDTNTGHYVDVLWNLRIVSDPQSKSFDSDGGWWEPGATYKITVVVKVDFMSAVTTSQVFFTNFEAYNGTCSVKPLEGEAGVTDFTFLFPDWKDEFNRPSRSIVLDAAAILLYNVQQRAAVDTPAVYYGAEISSTDIILPACGTDNNYCNVDITVIDPFRGKATCTVAVKVTSSAQLSASANKEQHYQAVIQSIDKIKDNMKHAKQIGDPLKIAQLAAVYSTILSSMDTASSVREDFTFFTAENITNERALPFLLDPSTEVNPIRTALSMANQQLVNDIGGAFDNEFSDDLHRLKMYVKSLSTVTSDQHILLGQSLRDSSILASKISDKLSGQKRDLHTLSGPVDFLNVIVQLLNNIVKIGAFDMKSLEPETSLLSDSGLSRKENTYIAALVAKRKSYNIASIQKHIPEIVKYTRHIWSILLLYSHQLARYNGSYEFNVYAFSATIQKTTRENILNKNYVAKGNNLLNSFSVTDVEVEDNFTDIHIEVLRSKNIFTHGDHSKFITSDVYIASISRDNGTKLNMIAPSITHDIGVEDCSVGESVQLITPKFLNEDAALMFYHSFNHEDTNARICIIVKPSASAIFYRMYIKAGSEPTDLSYDYRVTLPIETLQNCRETCIPSNKLTKAGQVFIGLRPFLEHSLTTRKRKRATFDSLSANYFFGITSVTCYNWEEEVVDWKASQCKISRGNKTVTCSCSDGPELIHALSFNFAPNVIHFPKVFSKFDVKNQGEVLALLLSIYFIVIMVGCWAHYKDRKGIFQWGVFPLSDNYTDENYFYLITVHTGLRKSAGTKSKVSFCLSGEMEETGVRQLTDGIREGFPTASVLHFVMACPKPLGGLQCLRIWHDNSGKGSEASWYLDRVDVTDIQSGYTYYFVCGEWLTPEKNTIDKVIEASNVKDLQSLKSMLFFNAKKHFTDDHIWMSVLIRPDWSRFSRMDRVGCCLAFLLLAMITNAMFYKGAPDNDRQRPDSDLQIGPIRLSIQQLYNSLISAVVTAIPITAIVMIFRRARTTTREESEYCCGRHKITDAVAIDAEKSRNSCCAKMPWMTKLEKQLLELEKILLIKPDAEEIKNAWPHFWRYITWALVFAVTIVCSFFVILYTMEWGRDVTEEWLSSFFLSFLQSMFVVDPFKVILISFLLSVFIKKTTVKGVHELDLKHILQVNREYGIKNKSPRESISFLSTLSEEELKAVTRKRKIHLMIRSTLCELTIHGIFLIIVCSLCYASHSTHDYHLYKQIHSDLVEDEKVGFNSITSTAQYFDWLENVLVPWIFPEKDTNGQLLKSDERQQTSVWNLYHLGAPRLRQVRMKKEDCLYNFGGTKPCIDKYYIFKEDTTEYCLGWSKTPCPQTDPLHVTAGAWYHRSALSIFGPPIVGEYNTYGGGGYILNLDINLIVARAIIQEMKKYLWVDQQTRALFLEMTIYCPDVNRFIYITLLAEFIETGGVVPYVSIYPFTVYSPTGYIGTYVLICEVLYVVFTAFSLVYVLFVLSRQRWTALKNFWFMVDFAAVVTAISAAAIYHMRMSSAKMALSKMKEDRMLFMNFHQVVLYDRGFVMCLGFLIAIAFFRLLKLAGYSQRTMRVYHVLRLAVGILPSFFTYICLVILSFAFLGYSLFHSTSEYFKTFSVCMMTLFTGLLGHSGFKETNLPESDNWETILFFCLFVVICVMFLTNLFMAILLDILTLTAQKDCDAIKSDEAQIFSLLWNSFLTKIGLNRKPANWMPAEDAPAEGREVPQANIDHYNHQFDRIMHIASRLLDDQDGVAILQWVRSHEPHKQQQYKPEM